MKYENQSCPYVGAIVLPIFKVSVEIALFDWAYLGVFDEQRIVGQTSQNQ